ncbi:class I SAM-dependent methyltransferase [Planomonospora sp. ID67723]|uniref:O-methyltransferase n=1 Tax=Planomonospora sp. ID67723 TaxID=2738134 RepID=UPI0018C376F6|nr:class I SAM-dependent methyltransferase [Planomonospora sp. ID67723]MBG0831460.1 class I SAM-dependent methyltransferase [Planomonospora sp. ID67723]
MQDPLFIDPAVRRYLLAHSTSPDEGLQALAADLQEHGSASAAIPADLAHFLTLIVQMTRARAVAEVGAVTGYASLCLARGLPRGGKLTCFVATREQTTLAQRHWERAGVADRITLRIGPPAERLRDLPFVPALDLAVITAGPAERAQYYPMLLPHLGAGGLILIPDALDGGAVAHPAAFDETTQAIDAFNDTLAADERISVLMLPLADGVSLIRKR